MALRSNVQAVILAAGQSKLFKTENTKLSFPICGQEMILYPVKMLENLNIPTTVVLGHQRELLRKIIDAKASSITYVEQLEQRGTGHALLCARAQLQAEHVLVINGDAPLVTPAMIQDMIAQHFLNDATVTFATSHNEDPGLEGYGRVMRKDSAVEIIEYNDKRDTSSLCCVNGGIYIFKRSFLEAALHRIPPYTHSGEFGVPELIGMASAQGLIVETVQLPFDNVRNVTTLKDLWVVEHIKRSELISYWMTQGVRFSFAQNVHLDIDVTIGPDTLIGVGVHLLNGTNIGAHCVVDGFTYISNSILHDHVHLLPHCYIYDSAIHAYAQIGPFAHIRKGSVIDTHVTVGNFVEVSSTTLGSHTKAKHFSYLSNAAIGSHVNIGAGTITGNHDGHGTKHPIVIKEGAFIGSNSTLVAPITIGKGAMTAAGSTLTKHVPDQSLGIARPPQINKEGYASRLRSRFKEAEYEEKHTCTCAHEANAAMSIEVA